MNDRGESSTSGSSNVMSFLTDSRNKTVKPKDADWQSLCINAQYYVGGISNRVRNKTQHRS
jgi:hypothetical protein